MGEFDNSLSIFVISAHTPLGVSAVAVARIPSRVGYHESTPTFRRIHHPSAAVSRQDFAAKDKFQKM